jgi:hypothetical protein
MNTKSAAGPQDFTSKMVEQQSAVCEGIHAQIEQVMNDPNLSLVEKAKRARMLNHQYDVSYQIMLMLVKAEEERMKKVLQT